jgi:hypothetical protein
MDTVRPRKASFVRRLERRVPRLYRRARGNVLVERGDGWVSYRDERAVLLRKGPRGPVRGIYLRGACDLPSLFALAPIVIGELQGTFCIHQSGRGVSDARSDLLLQSYTGVPPDFAEEIHSRFHLPRGYFRPSLFEPAFDVPGLPDARSLPKTVIVLSILPDLSRTAYRHRASGYLVDPGAGWLNRLDSAITDLSFVHWFNENFEPLGRMSEETMREAYGRLIPAIKHETGAHILVFNSLEVEPFDITHDYSVRNLESVSRRRRFNIALTELASALDFSVVDVDRVLKEQGVSDQVDFSHFPVDRMRAVAQEAHVILRDLGVV